MESLEQNNNFAVCVGRQLGSGGRDVAKLVSEKLGIAFYDREIILATAKESGLTCECFEKSDERRSIPVMGCYGEMGMSFYGFGSMLGGSAYLSDENLFKIQSDTILKLSAQGPSVFVGRCADYILRDMPQILSVFITANKEDRLARLSAKLSITLEEAAVKIKECDRKRAEYYNYYTFKKWGDAASYDFCLSTSVMGIEEVADRIVAVCREKFL